MPSHLKHSSCLHEKCAGKKDRRAQEGGVNWTGKREDAAGRDVINHSDQGVQGEVRSILTSIRKAEYDSSS